MRRLTTLAFALGAPLALASAACDGATAPPEEPGVAQLRQVLPTTEDMTILLPQSTALVPEQATYYAFTRELTLNVNGLVRDITNVIEDVVELPPTDTDGATYAVWGPWTEALSPATYRVTVAQASDGGYDYTVEGWPKDADESAAVVLLSGHHLPGEGVHRGDGGWTYDLTAAHALDPIAQDSVGAIGVSYALGDARALEVTFDAVQGPHDPQTTSALYRYTEAADGSGTLDFTSNLDIHEGDDPSLDRRELVQVRSRWLATGPGRADVVASHGDLGPDVTVDVTECWDAGFARTYVALAWPGAEHTDGDAAACPYGDRQLPAFDGFDPDAFADGDLVVALPDPTDLTLEPAPVTEEAPEVALYYRVAKDTVESLKQHTRGVLDMVHDITRHPASACQDNTCRWGPWTDWTTEITAMLVVSANEDGSYGYRLMAQRVGDGEDAWQTLVEGGAIDDGDGNGRGAFTYDLDVQRALGDDEGDATGVMRVEYGRAGAEARLHVRHTASDSDFEQEYLLAANAEAGYLDLSLPTDIDDGDPARAAAEQLEARIRWLASGAGVADVTAVGGDLGDAAEVLAVECWDTTAARTHIDLVTRAAGETTTPDLDGPGCVFTDWQTVDFPEMGADQDG